MYIYIYIPAYQEIYKYKNGKMENFSQGRHSQSHGKILKVFQDVE